MTVHQLCATPLLPAIADRAQAEFNAVTMQERQLTTAETIAALAAHPTIAAVLVSSRIRFDADAIAMLPPHVRLIATCSVGHEHIDLAAARAGRVSRRAGLRSAPARSAQRLPYAAHGHRHRGNPRRNGPSRARQCGRFLRGSTPRDALWHGSS